jgi:hypothetical protein
MRYYGGGPIRLFSGRAIPIGMFILTRPMVCGLPCCPQNDRESCFAYFETFKDMIELMKLTLLFLWRLLQKGSFYRILAQ